MRGLNEKKRKTKGTACEQDRKVVKINCVKVCREDHREKLLEGQEDQGEELWVGLEVHGYLTVRRTGTLCMQDELGA
jgi:hypothetical protein